MDQRLKTLKKSDDIPGGRIHLDREIMDLFSPSKIKLKDVADPHDFFFKTMQRLLTYRFFSLQNFKTRSILTNMNGNRDCKSAQFTEMIL